MRTNGRAASRRRTQRIRRTRRLRAGLVAGAAVAVVSSTVSLGVADDRLTQGEPAAEAAPATAADAELVATLVAVHEDLPTLADDFVTIGEDGVWTARSGDFADALVALNTVADRLRSVFVAADEAQGPVADAVARDAAALLAVRHAVESLATYESHDLAYPVDGTDAHGATSSADSARGLAETGLRLLLDARAERLDALSTLVASDALNDAQRDALTEALGHELGFHADERFDFHTALALPAPREVVTVERFTSAAPGEESRARSLVVQCVERDGELADCRDVPGGDVADEG